MLGAVQLKSVVNIITRDWFTLMYASFVPMNALERFDKRKAVLDYEAWLDATEAAEPVIEFALAFHEILEELSTISGTSAREAFTNLFYGSATQPGIISLHRPYGKDGEYLKPPGSLAAKSRAQRFQMIGQGIIRFFRTYDHETTLI